MHSLKIYGGPRVPLISWFSTHHFVISETSASRKSIWSVVEGEARKQKASKGMTCSEGHFPNSHFGWFVGLFFPILVGNVHHLKSNMTIEKRNLKMIRCVYLLYKMVIVQPVMIIFPGFPSMLGYPTSFLLRQQARCLCCRGTSPDYMGYSPRARRGSSDVGRGTWMKKQPGRKGNKQQQQQQQQQQEQQQEQQQQQQQRRNREREREQQPKSSNQHQ